MWKHLVVTAMPVATKVSKCLLSVSVCGWEQITNNNQQPVLGMRSAGIPTHCWVFNHQRICPYI